jgi:hypothetical protein
MSKLERLTERLCELVGRNVAAKMEVQRLTDEQVARAEEIGQLQCAISEEQGRLFMERIRADGEQPDLRMASGTPICVECRKGRLLDENGRCSECAGMVAGASA